MIIAGVRHPINPTHVKLVTLKYLFALEILRSNDAADRNGRFSDGGKTLGPLLSFLIRLSPGMEYQPNIRLISGESRTA